ncbi:MAG: carboxymuconolactone decarboxylase family protein [Candidatus Acidiferrales bacterium]
MNSAVGRANVTEVKLLELDNFETSAAFTERERLALRLAHRLTATPADVDHALFAQLKQHFSDKQLVELGSAIAWENYPMPARRV